MYANRPMSALSGYSLEELVGESVEMLVPGDRRREHAGNRLEFFASGRGARPMGTGLQIDLLRKDGSRLPVDIALSPVEGEDAQLVAAAVRDASDRRRLEEERREVLRRLGAVNDVASAILSGRPVSVVLDLIAGHARQLAGAHLAVIALPDESGRELTLAAVDGEASERLIGMRLPVDGSAAGHVFESGEPWRSPNASEEAQAYRPMVVEGGMGPTAVVPLSSAGTVLGTMSIANRVGGYDFSPAQVATLQAFASQAGVAIEYSRARDELRRLAVIEDRERIGRELHDGVIQVLFGVGMELQAAAAAVDDKALAGRLEKTVGELDRAIRDLRGYIFGLRPGLLAERQLGQAIAAQAADLEEKSGITAVVEIDPAVAAALTPVAGDVVQLLREALSNVARHSGAATCRISLARQGAWAVLTVDDDGRGFVREQVAGSGQGLRNLRERAESLGGSLELNSDQGGGTEVRMHLPLRT